MILIDVYNLGKKIIKNKNDLLIIIKKIWKYDRVHISLNYNETVKNEDLDLFFHYISRLQSGEPVQYIVRESEFLGLKFEVGKGVFIPRPETEILVKWIIDNFPNDFSGNIVDLCSGSGIIPVCLKENFGNSNVWAIEKSEEAFKFLCRNIKKHKVCVNYICGDIFEEFNRFEDEFFDIIVSNPPYIKISDIQYLDKNVKFEPIMALNGGADGIYFYDKIVKKWSVKLKKRGIFVFEIGWGQYNQVHDILDSHGFKKVSVVHDFFEIERIVIGTKF